LAQYRRCLDTNAGSAADDADSAPRAKKGLPWMINQDTTTTKDNSSSRTEGKVSTEEPTREKEQGEASEPDAPTAGEENAGMSTILGGGVGTGVQDDADDE
jgi:hypothetical protein